MHFKNTIYRLGSTPKLSLKRFFIGMILFAISAALIIYGYLYEALFQIPGLVLLPIALFFALYGYLGIFANRFSQVLKDRSALNRDIF
ncbi:hypothetical protein [Pseudoalteromonas denitrificans]|jgi:predicted MFS family arabinose efflux permease|uniref:Uncharacterized protein n=1 Tax=Pseudoalteromonas denitrificans DSM 6059 TaxID=1123010 RepID=A0A1I1QI75_9GAMM|nr:hypothetical protein [Pseudoalteromonas denitrificans]SFD21811.1 hypothetical protein SAMN02745724_03906 [Pseudoalteromonas denitrificans DSM 6059]